MTKPQATTLMLGATGKTGRLSGFVKRAAATGVRNS